MHILDMLMHSSNVAGYVAIGLFSSYQGEAISACSSYMLAIIQRRSYTYDPACNATYCFF